MSEIQRILDQLDRAFEGNAWHGPSVRELLNGVPADRAAAKRVPGGHSIWEITLHLTAWHDVARRRISGEKIVDLAPEEDWPRVPNSGDAAWRRTIENLIQSKQKLRQSISQLLDQNLEDIVPGKGYSNYFLLHGVIQHDLYHAGQIAVLKKLTSP